MLFDAITHFPCCFLCRRKSTSNIVLYSIFLLIAGCSSAPDSVKLSVHDYCAEPLDRTTQTLSQFTGPFASEMQYKTGVYILEQGTSQNKNYHQ
ncbi:hypothetical protein BSQ33_09220 [Vibrio gazogenes]|uniref:Uncharacterized protein n=1 Tax=Vibrio gazogenes TaxID=687 RepID=A0A1Z2SF92_VIBGA|nr:hypothetical protein BSQ33_09220 [Vibrio gazogenes]